MGAEHVKNKDALAASLKAFRSDAAKPEPDAPPAGVQRDPAKFSGPVGAVAQSMRTIEARSVRDVDPAKVRPSRFSDRLDPETGIDGLVESIRDRGQQIPILVRRVEPDPPGGPSLEIVYGRRRLAACSRLSIPVKALVTEFNEIEATIAQGLENAERLETSYIERAIFASQLEAAGYEPQTIQQTLNTDKSTLSRMRSLIRSVPTGVIRAIGSADGVGRRPWDELRKAIEQSGQSEAEIVSLITRHPDPVTRLKKLTAALSRVEPPAPKPARPDPVAIGSARLSMKRSRTSVSLQARDEDGQAFLEHLSAIMPELYEKWRAQEDTSN